MSEDFDISKTEYLSIPMTAEMLGLSVQRVHSLVKQKRLRGQVNVANRWLVPSPPEIIPAVNKRGRPFKRPEKRDPKAA